MSSFVLVGGAWLGAWVWERVTPYLEAAGHDVVPFTLVGLAERRDEMPPVTLTVSRQSEDLAAKISGRELEGVVLVGHSHSGLITGMVADYSPTILSRHVYLDADVPQTDMSFVEGWGDEGIAIVTQAVEESGEDRWPPLVEEIEFSMEEDDAKWVLSHSTSHPAASLFEPVPLRPGAHARVPTTYIQCTKGSPELRPIVEETIDKFNWQHLKIDTHHWPMVSDPKALAETLLSLDA